MSERKGINKYYPPDWDPSKVVKKKKSGNNAIKVRLNTPFSMRCLKCNEYISSLRKFNAKKEYTNEKYLSIKIIRFHITCPRCNNNITFKTNPQTADYVTESGAVRNYEPKTKVADVPKDREETEEEILLRLEREEKEDESYQQLKEKRKKNPFWKKQESLKDQDGDLMENLERRLVDQQKQQEIQDSLIKLQTKSAAIHAKGGSAEIFNETQEKSHILKRKLSQMIEKKDEEEAEDAFRNFKEKRIILNVVKEEEVEPEKNIVIEKPSTTTPILQKMILKKKHLPESVVKEGLQLPKKEAVNLSTLVGSYSSSEESDNE